jgi:hypothetical protein
MFALLFGYVFVFNMHYVYAYLFIQFIPVCNALFDKFVPFFKVNGVVRTESSFTVPQF